jgi:hypothetical protein
MTAAVAGQRERGGSHSSAFLLHEAIQVHKVLKAQAVGFANAAITKLPRRFYRGRTDSVNIPDVYWRCPSQTTRRFSRAAPGTSGEPIAFKLNMGGGVFVHYLPEQPREVAFSGCELDASGPITLPPN